MNNERGSQRPVPSRQTIHTSGHHDRRRGIALVARKMAGRDSGVTRPTCHVMLPDAGIIAVIYFQIFASTSSTSLSRRLTYHSEYPL